MNGELKNILLDDGIAKTLNENQSSLRTTVQFAVQKGYHCRFNELLGVF
jgi:6-phosphogluconate dehydrogenase